MTGKKFGAPPLRTILIKCKEYEKGIKRNISIIGVKKICCKMQIKAGALDGHCEVGSSVPAKAILVAHALSLNWFQHGKLNPLKT
jgi:hypothetical protein